FSAEEWARIAGSPIAAGIAVTAAEPSGLFGMLKESFSSASALAEAQQNQGAGELIKSVAADLTSSETRSAVRANLDARFKGATRSDIKGRAIEELKAVGALLDSKAPEDSAAFKAWLRGIAQRTAEAAKEGGFLGIGGVPVSPAETAALAELDKALAA
ncbi:MAG: hypothetical protein ABWZ80_06360, partial [Beijerinckiaceae bacterium]